MHCRKSNYGNNKFFNSKQLHDVINRDDITKDRSYMIDLLKDNKNILDDYQIFEYVDFCGIFIQFKCSCTDIRNFLQSFVQYYNVSYAIDNNHKILWLKPRICKQSNQCEKNVFFSRLVIEYESIILEYLQIFLSKQLNSTQIKNEFIDEFKNKIQLIKNQLRINNINQKEVNEKISMIDIHDDYNSFNDDYFEYDEMVSELYFQ